MKSTRIHLIPNDWSYLERVLNLLSSNVISQSLTEKSSPAFSGLKIDSLNGVLKADKGVVSGNALIYDDSFKALITNF